uniref:Ketoreductase (KR) domain-containing protein n=1 Tax=Chromera velia CCMP2878 TaxID=1169474 RepID=A0A0G4I5J0_9ALVE|mmetsp:Transcript_39653/g.78088  ORF Transcript_39653/g.78088 Transcript_39653/m.78088 type:complete len:352 (-) Transcript_39653:164-1219(-)|eukprot:Cvel_11122.t1-p1 / transcript=Cvel_11122.t1 / gene=Cvel_11122 / organism=Chromera_velia_CCMP2878 / gene_product=Probable chlorophyll(ide) b reductase NYC1,, putative / transcript_product=Probable chlorophyll(ide) b reductase NYC1,, putative / location=Cvel_scaffold689:8639-10143(+) / protein_length=351 / sequence_SO=supercontig / SO=protein_coding / is_pseudo=false
MCRRSMKAGTSFLGLFVTVLGPSRLVTGFAVSVPQSKGKVVVITGGAGGLGFALAEEFLSFGDGVVIAGRDERRLETAAAALLRRGRRETETASERTSESRVKFRRCDVRNADDVGALADFAVSEFGSVDLWVNNAATRPRGPLGKETAEYLRECVETNVLGSMLGCREAVRVMRACAAKKEIRESECVGHIFNMGFSEFGASFSASPATHKATKRALPALTKALREELKKETDEERRKGKKGVNIGVHELSPGLVLTDLLLENASGPAKRIFNVLAEEPDTVARELVPQMRSLSRADGDVVFLPPVCAVSRLLQNIPTLLSGDGRFFDSRGERVRTEGVRYSEWGAATFF